MKPGDLYEYCSLPYGKVVTVRIVGGHHAHPEWVFVKDVELPESVGFEVKISRLANTRKGALAAAADELRYYRSRALEERDERQADADRLNALIEEACRA